MVQGGGFGPKEWAKLGTGNEGASKGRAQASPHLANGSIEVAKPQLVLRYVTVAAQFKTVNLRVSGRQPACVSGLRPRSCRPCRGRAWHWTNGSAAIQAFQRQAVQRRNIKENG